VQHGELLLTGVAFHGRVVPRSPDSLNPKTARDSGSDVRELCQELGAVPLELRRSDSRHRG
jgi:hypothetical protein